VARGPLLISGFLHHRIPSEQIGRWSLALNRWNSGRVADCNCQYDGGAIYIITLRTGRVSRQLLYHISNNKQRQQEVTASFSSRGINRILRTQYDRKNAERAMKQEVEGDGSKVTLFISSGGWYVDQSGG
jgi:hypothetical protein